VTSSGSWLRSLRDEEEEAASASALSSGPREGSEGEEERATHFHILRRNVSGRVPDLPSAAPHPPRLALLLRSSSASFFFFFLAAGVSAAGLGAGAAATAPSPSAAAALPSPLTVGEAAAERFLFLGVLRPRGLGRCDGIGTWPLSAVMVGAPTLFWRGGGGGRGGGPAGSATGCPCASTGTAGGACCSCCSPSAGAAFEPEPEATGG